MRSFIVVIVSMAVIVGGIIALSRLKGPKMYVVPVGEFGYSARATNVFRVKSPSTSAWFSMLILFVENGELEMRNNVEIEVFLGGKSVFRKVFYASQLLQQNPIKRNSFGILLSDISFGGSAGKALGYGNEFEISARLLEPSNQRIKISAKFVDDRLIR